jgi:hypothetical protein
MFKVNLTHRDIPDSTRSNQQLAIIAARHQVQNERQQACNERPYLDRVAKLEELTSRLCASNDRREHGQRNL